MKILIGVTERKANGRLYPVRDDDDYAMDIVAELLGVTPTKLPEYDEEPDTYFMEVPGEIILRNSDQHGTFHLEGPAGAISAYVGSQHV